MRVLITNDDGVSAPGIEALARCARDAGHDVFVLAPSSEMSGTGASMGPLAIHRPIRIRPRNLPSLAGVAVHAAEAPPAACVILACLGAVGEPPELVLSGVNDGLNVGRSALHSGTVGAALAAAAWGARGIAVSTSTSTSTSGPRWDTAATVAVSIAGWVVEHCGAGAVNVNVPDRPLGGLRGLRWAGLAPVGAIRSCITGVERAEDGDGVTVLTDHRRTDPAQAPEDSDRRMVAQGYVTLTGLEGLAQWIPPDGDACEPSPAAMAPMVPGLGSSEQVPG